MCSDLCRRDGQSRQFGFVGFRSVAEAQAAVKYFNRSFMGAQRLTVEFAEKYGGSHLPRAWSKYTEGTSRYKKLHQVDLSVHNHLSSTCRNEHQDQVVWLQSTQCGPWIVCTLKHLSVHSRRGVQTRRSPRESGN